MSARSTSLRTAGRATARRRAAPPGTSPPPSSASLATPPLTARSVLLSLLLGNLPPRAPVSALVRTAGLFGIAEGTARTALSRMATAGEVTAHDGWYELTSARLLDRQRRQLASRSATTPSWDGSSWRQAVVVAEGRRPAAHRARLRDEFARARLAELREGVWLRPDNVGPFTLDAQEVSWFVVEPDGDPVALAHTLWDLDAWTAHARRLQQRMGELVEPLGRHDPSALADGFVTSAAVLRHFQADPLLPEALAPDDWPGADLRHDYDGYDAAYRACLAQFFRSGH